MGQILEKGEVLRQNKWHRVVVLWIVNPRGEVLLSKRALSKRLRPGMWDVSASGHVGVGEGERDCIIREAREELGLDIVAAELLEVGRATAVPPYLVAGFVLRADLPTDDFTFRDGEVAAVKYVPWQDLLALGTKGMQAANIVHTAPWQFLFDYIGGTKNNDI